MNLSSVEDPMQNQAPDSPDDQARRQFWAQQMELAHDFMMRAQQVEIADCGEPMACLRKAADDAGVEVVFSTTPFGGPFERQFILRRGLIDSYVAAAREMNDRGWILTVEDAYRTPQMQTQLQQLPALYDALLKMVLWETEGQVPESEFVFRRLLALIAFCPMVGTHISGSALDISVLRRDDGEEVDRGGTYIEFSIVTPMECPYVSEEAQRNRREITELMGRHGFIAYPWEFWHYNQQDAYEVVLKGDPSRGRYGPIAWDAESNTARPVANPTARLNSPEVIHEQVQAALARVDAG